MTIVVTLLYPISAKGTPFNMDYYLSKHMPLAHSTWSGSGMQKWNVTTLDPASGYVTQCIMYWDSMEQVEAAFGGDSAKKILADIPNYCDVEPLRVMGELVGEN